MEPASGRQVSENPSRIEFPAGRRLAHLRGRRPVGRDALGLVTDELQVLDPNRTRRPGLLTRAAVCEALTVPDLRNQSAEVSRAVLSILADAG